MEQAKIEDLAVFQKANRYAGLYPFEILEKETKEFAALIHRIATDFDRGSTQEFVNHFIDNAYNEINILLLSDFHFGNTTEHRIMNDLKNACERLSDQLPKRRLDMVFLLGDFIDKGNESGFQTAFQFVKVLCEKINFKDLPSDFIYSIPGNHDVVTQLALSAHVAGKAAEFKLEDTASAPSLRRFGMAPYHFFRDRITNGVKYFGDGSIDPISNRQHWVDFRWRSLGLLLVGFDSNTLPTIDKGVTGEISPEDLEEFRTEVEVIDRDLRNKLVLVVLSHHFSGDGESERGIRNKEVLRNICGDLGFNGVVFVNGDRHGDAAINLGRQFGNGQQSPLEIAAPTFCQQNGNRQQDASRGSILLQLGTQNGKITSAKTISLNFKEHGQIDVTESEKFLLGRFGWRMPD